MFHVYRNSTADQNNNAHYVHLFYEENEIWNQNYITSNFAPKFYIRSKYVYSHYGSMKNVGKSSLAL